jgi:hypothetical protein
MFVVIINIYPSLIFASKAGAALVELLIDSTKRVGYQPYAQILDQGTML